MSTEIRRLRAIKALIVKARHSEREVGERLLRQAEDELEALLTSTAEPSPTEEAAEVPWREGPASCTNCGESSKPYPAYADFVGPFCEGCWDKLREHFAAKPEPLNACGYCGSPLHVEGDVLHRVDCNRPIPREDDTPDD